MVPFKVYLKLKCLVGQLAQQTARFSNSWTIPLICTQCTCVFLYKFAGVDKCVQYLVQESLEIIVFYSKHYFTSRQNVNAVNSRIFCTSCFSTILTQARYKRNSFYGVRRAETTRQKLFWVMLTDKACPHIPIVEKGGRNQKPRTFLLIHCSLLKAGTFRLYHSQKSDEK